MGRFLSILLVMVLVSSLSMCSSAETPIVSSASIPQIPQTDVNEEDLEDLASGNGSFAFDLYCQLTDGNSNIFFSPYSISAALAMTYAGAEGTTEIEMAEVLRFTLPEDRLHPAFNLVDQKLTASSEEDSTFSLHIVNALWGQTGYDFLPDFLAALAANDGAAVRTADFSDDP
ncbi:MAG: serpin family protein [Candidatus Fermentibacteria bacterium]